MKKALIVQGGWDGHEPQLTSKRFAGLLEKHGYTCTISDTLDVLADLDSLMELDLIVACWTMGEIDHQYVENVSKAVGAGVGLAGCHGGMCDSFRQDTEWQFITGGQWVSHPGGDGIEYTVNICRGSSPIVEGLEDFPVCSEHYYLHVDPAIEVLATTRFPIVPYYHISNKPVLGQWAGVLHLPGPPRRCVRQVPQRPDSHGAGHGVGRRGQAVCSGARIDHCAL